MTKQDRYRRAAYTFLVLFMWGALMGTLTYMLLTYPAWYMKQGIDGPGSTPASFWEGRALDLVVYGLAGALISLAIFYVQQRKHGRLHYVRGALSVALALLVVMVLLVAFVQWYFVFRPIEPESNDVIVGMLYLLSLSIPATVCLIPTAVISGLALSAFTTWSSHRHVQSTISERRDS